MEYSRARFCEALSQENVKGFLSVLKNMNAQVNTPDAQGQTMLWHYVKARDYKKVEFLIRCDADPSVADHAGFTPVHLALMQGQAIDEIIARMLLDSRPTSSISNILKGGLSLDELLLDHSDNRDTHDGVDVLKLLLELGADVNIVNSERETPLMRAAHLGDLKAIEILLKQENINLYNKDRYGQTALHIATREGQLGAVNELLSSQRLDVNYKNSHGSSAFWLSVYLGREHISERFLNDSRVDVNAMGGGAIHRWQTTALYTACLHEKSQMVSRILAARRFPEVDPNIQGDGRKSPLGAAAYQDAYEVVELLLKADGIRINANDGREDDPFWLRLDGVQCR